MAKSNSMLSLQGTFDGMTHVNSKAYGKHIRAARGTHTRADVNEAFRSESIQLISANVPAKIGSYSNTGIFGNYAYMIKDPVHKGVFSMGVSFGFNNYNADFSDLNLRSAQDQVFSGFMSEFKPNFGGGIFYYNKKIFGGFSVPTILTHSELFNGPLEQLKTPRFYYLYGGVKLALDPRTEKVILSPSFLLRVQDGTPLSVDYNLSVAFDELISLGTSYRTGDGAISYINYKLSEKFYVGYSYDWTVSDIRMYSRGTHEIMINYRTRLRTIHRDLECPVFFSH